MQIKANSKLFSLFSAVVAAALFFSACSDSTTGVEGENESQLKIQTAENIPANADAERGAPADFTFYSLTEGKIIPDSDSASTKWDIAFSATTIITNGGASGPGNGGAVVLDVAFDQLTVAPPDDDFFVDTDSTLAIPTSSDNGWYHYTGETNPPRAILPLPNTTIVVRTAEGKYAKIKILSYYKDNPDVTGDTFANPQTRADDRYYTFKYAVQLNGSKNLN